jgi:hypothetical protein
MNDVADITNTPKSFNIGYRCVLFFQTKIGRQKMNKKKMVVAVCAFVGVLLVGIAGIGAYSAPRLEQVEGLYAISCGDSVSCSRTDWVMRVINTGSGHGIYGRSQTTKKNKAGVYGEASDAGIGVYGKGKTGIGVRGTSTSESGVYGNSSSGNGVYGLTKSDSIIRAGVYGNASGSASGIRGNSVNGCGGRFSSDNGDGIIIESAGLIGVHINKAGTKGCYIDGTEEDALYVENAGDNGVYINGAGQSGILVAQADEYGGSFCGDLCGIRTISSNILIDAWDEDATGLYNHRFKVDNAGNVTADGTYTSPCSDFAEMLPATDELEPGDVLVIGINGELAMSQEPYDTAVAGVYSTKPGFIGGVGDDEDLIGQVPLAVVGVVPVKASAENGSIVPGDLLTTSGTPGHAMKATEPEVGTVIGKALGTLESGTGIIDMLVTLQ